MITTHELNRTNETHYPSYKYCRPAARPIDFLLLDLHQKDVINAVLHEPAQPIVIYERLYWVCGSLDLDRFYFGHLTIHNRLYRMTVLSVPPLGTP